MTLSDLYDINEDKYILRDMKERYIYLFGYLLIYIKSIYIFAQGKWNMLCHRIAFLNACI